MAIAYYAQRESPKEVYVITTAKKRESLDWVKEAARFGLGTRPDASVSGVLRVDSWNNIRRYVDVKEAFFIFDEQRLVGSGVWVKSFLKIARANRWILLSATPGDTWLDYAPVFVANGWYRNITDFKRQHVVYAPYVKYPKVDRYIGERGLERLRNRVLVEMPYERLTTRHLNYLDVGFDKELVKKIQKERWNYAENRPIEDIAELWRTVRMVVNSDPSRLRTIWALLETHPKLIIFYNFNYELEILRSLRDRTEVREWNGHRHQEVPQGDSWVYLVQYTAGAEGWNCVTTDAMCFYSYTYSYKNFAQAQGRIDRLNTEFTDLYYYILQSQSFIDSALRGTIAGKHAFNERKFLENWGNSAFPVT